MPGWLRDLHWAHPQLYEGLRIRRSCVCVRTYNSQMNAHNEPCAIINHKYENQKEHQQPAHTLIIAPLENKIIFRQIVG